MMMWPFDMNHPQHSCGKTHQTFAPRYFTAFLLSTKATLLTVFGLHHRWKKPQQTSSLSGRGLSGLRAAVGIHESGHSVIVLEAKDRVGGKTLSMDASALGGRIDLGAAWLNDTNQSEMHSLAKKFGYRLITQRDTGLKLQQRPDGSIVGKPFSPAAVSCTSFGDSTPSFDCDICSYPGIA